MATKRITINKSDGTKDTVDLEIPDKPGTYNIKFKTTSNKNLNAGNIVCPDSYTANTYNLKFGLSNGTTIEAGRFTTPSWHDISLGYYESAWDPCGGEDGNGDYVDEWHTVYPELYGVSSFDVSRLKAGCLTEIRCTGQVYDSYMGDQLGISGTFKSDSGVFYGEMYCPNDEGGNAVIGYTLTMGNGWIEFNPYGSGTGIDDMETPYTPNVNNNDSYVKITSIKQYY